MNTATTRPVKPTRRMPIGAVALIGTLAALAVPAVATATTDRWVDADTGSNAGGNTCTAQASPCKTIMQAGNASQSTGTAGTIHVDQGTYNEDVNIAQANHLVADDFVAGDSGPTTINGTGTALFAQANASASGFVITSPTGGSVVLLADSGSLSDSTVTAKGSNSTAIEVFATTGHPAVSDNTIVADSGDEGRGVQVDQNVAGTTISGNQIGAPGAGFDIGVQVRQGSGADISGNTIQGMRQFSGVNSNGIRLIGTTDVTISGNAIDSPAHDPGDESNGIYADAIGADGSVALSHNTIIGMTGIGEAFGDVAGNVSVDNDVIARSSGYGVWAASAPAVSITGPTIVDNAPSMFIQANVAIDSSLLDDPINASSGATCTITYSRGPAISESADGCAAFQSTANPRFVDEFGAVPDLHLAADSPLIDAGNPAAPASGATDIDGDARALEGDGACPADGARDIGADEVVTTVAACPVTPPDGTDRDAPQTKVAGKRKQRGHVAHFSLSSSESGSTFECRIDRGRFAPCPADYASRRLNLGRHTLFVRATDAAGNTDPSVEAMKFKLKRPRV